MRRKLSVAEDLISGFQELAESLEAGADLSTEFNCYQMQFDLRPETHTPDQVKDTRKRLGASQAVFAKFLGVSGKAVSEWERGTVRPSLVARRFMDEIRRHPAHYIQRLRESMVRKNTKRKKRV